MDSIISTKFFSVKLNLHSDKCSRVSPPIIVSSDPSPETRALLSMPMCFLFPSVVGSGIAYLVSLQSILTDESEQGISENDSNKYPKNGISILTLSYVSVSISGIAIFIYRSIRGYQTKEPLFNLLPVGIGLVSAIFLFASVNLAIFTLFPKSFSGQTGKNFSEKVVAFLYYSILSISVGPAGDILPTEITTRLLLAMQGLTNLAIFGLLISSLLSA